MADRELWQRRASGCLCGCDFAVMVPHLFGGAPADTNTPPSARWSTSRLQAWVDVQLRCPYSAKVVQYAARSQLWAGASEPKRPDLHRLSPQSEPKALGAEGNRSRRR